MSILKKRTMILPLYQGDDAQELAELRMAVAIAERQLEVLREEVTDQQQHARRVGDPVAVTSEDIEAAKAEVRKKKAAYNTAVDGAAERALELKVQPIGSRRFRELVAAHPVRMAQNEQGETYVQDDEDVEFGVNVETFPMALMTYVDPEDTEIRTVVGPVFKGTRDTQDFFEDEVSDGDFDKVWKATYFLNRSPGADPKALRYSPSTGETSE